jgi:WD40 repeat protein
VNSDKKLNVFVSYSHADEAWLKRVQVHLKPLAREGRLELWDDTRIKTGQRWRDEIRAAIAQADVAILLVSADFYASDFIANNELPPLLETAHTERGLAILGVHINYSDFENDRILSEYQTVNTPNQPIEDLESRGQQEKIFRDLARRIRELLETPKPLDASPGAAAGGKILGRLYGEIPKLPPHYLERSKELEAIKAKLLGGDGASVGVVGARRGAAVQGMGGVGKTVLAAAVIQDEQIRASFRDGIVWLTLGQTPDMLILQRRLLAWVAPDKEPPSEIPAGRDALDTALKSRRWLIVLDDVWRHTDLRAFEVADTPSRLLITTRDDAVVRASGAVPYVVEELTEPAARAFLGETVGLPEADLPPVADDVVRECGRLPLALALAGATLADTPRDAELWRDVVAALRAADHDQLRAEFDYPYPHALAAIEASVDFLAADDKAAYLQLAIFPEDAPIPLAALEKLWDIAGLKLRNRVKLFVDRALARRQDDHTVLLHDLQGDFVRKRCPDVPATHQALLQSYRPDEGAAWVDVVDDYLIDWLPYHLMGSGRGDECRDLLFDLAWLRRKLSARDVNALIADTGLCPGDVEVEKLGRVLRMSAHVLNRDTRQLTAQLLGRLGKEDGIRTARLLNVAGRQLAPGVLVPRGAAHLLSPGALLQTLEGHMDRVFGVLLDDGVRALSWSEDRTLRLWDLESGVSRVLEGHNDWVYGAVLLDEDMRALSWSRDHTLRLWELKSGASRVLEGHSDYVTGAVLVNGRRVLSWSYDHTLRLWDLENGTSRTLKGHSDWVLGATLLPDGAHALSWSHDHTLRLWDLASGETRELAGHGESVRGAVVLADGVRALSWSWDNTLRLWDLASGASRPLEGHRGRINGAAVLPDGMQALSWSEDGTLRLWDLASGAKRVLEGHRYAVDETVVLADGAHALSWSLDAARVWDLESGESKALQGCHRHTVCGAVLLPGGARALSWSYDHTLRVWDLAKDLSRALEGHSGWVLGAVPLPDGVRALSWSADATVRIWDLESNTGRALEGHSDNVNGAVLVDARRVLSWSKDGTLRIWSVESDASRALEGHRTDVWGAVLSPDGLHALSWSHDHTLRLWELESGASRALEGHSESVRGAVVLADGVRALSWSYDHTLRLWDLENGTSRTLKGHNDWVLGATLLPDGAHALSWSHDHTLRLWDLASGETRELAGHSDPVRGAVLLPDGARALSWSHDGTLRLWDLEGGASRALEGHSHVVHGAVPLPDGAHALSWSHDHTLRLWDLESGASRALEGHSSWVWGSVLLPDGAHALSWSEDRSLRLWELESGASRMLEQCSGKINGAVVLTYHFRVLSWSQDGMLRLWDLSSLQEVASFVGDDPVTCCIVSGDERLAVVGDSRGRVMFFDLPA